MEIYMIRHGESVANATRVHAGWAQVPLSSKGEQEAEQKANILRDVHFDKIYCSDLLRAIQTKEIMMPHIPAILSPLLREINVGELAGKSANQCLEEYGERYKQDKAVRDFTFFGGEEHNQHRSRVKEFMDTLQEEKAKKVAIFCHEGTIRCALELAKDPMAYVRTIGNCNVYVLRYSDSAWEFVAELTT